MKLIIFFLSILFIFLNHPLTFGFILLIQTILIRLITGNLNFNFWFSYILFLIIIGGILILFIYITRIASNEKFKFSYKLSLLLLTLFIFLIIRLFLDSYFYSENFNIRDLNNKDKTLLFNLTLIKYTNWPNNKVIFIIILYLLITLIAIVKITKIKYGPLRPKN